jgi:hypothetical protein
LSAIARMATQEPRRSDFEPVRMARILTQAAEHRQTARERGSKAQRGLCDRDQTLSGSQARGLLLAR